MAQSIIARKSGAASATLPHAITRGIQNLRTTDDGRKLAARMLRTIERMGDASDEYAFDAYSDDEQWGRSVWRTAPQRNLLAEVIALIQERPEVLNGFTLVLTDFIVSCAQGSVPDSACYARPALEATDARRPN